MTQLDIIREDIKKLYSENKEIHINVSLSRPKLTLLNQTVKIKGVYSHIFMIEECSTGAPKTYTLQYSDVLLGHIEIEELKTGKE